jgi:hypothetical protein
MRDKIPDIVAAITNSDRRFLMCGFSVYLLAVFTIGLRLRRVLSVQSIRLSAKESIYLTFIGYFFNNFLPTSFGGDLLKAYYAGRKSGKKPQAFAGVFMDRALAMVPFTLVPAFTVTFFSHRIYNKGLIFVIYILFTGCLVFLWVLLHRRSARYLAFMLKPFSDSSWYNKLKRGYSHLNLYIKHRTTLLWSFALSLSAQIISIVATYCFARAVGVDYVNIGIFFIIVPVVWIMTLTPSLNGLGIREGGFLYLLRSYMPPEKAVAVSILVLASLLGFGIIGGIIYTMKKNLFTFKEEDI